MTTTGDHMDSRDDGLPELETVCPVCNGRGGELFDYDEWDDCCRCNGAGHVPTKAGEKILLLMRHNFKWMLKKATPPSVV